MARESTQCRKIDYTELFLLNRQLRRQLWRQCAKVMFLRSFNIRPRELVGSANEGSALATDRVRDHHQLFGKRSVSRCPLPYKRGANCTLCERIRACLKLYPYPYPYPSASTPTTKKRLPVRARQTHACAEREATCVSLSRIRYRLRQLLHVQKCGGTKVSSPGHSVIDARDRHPVAVLNETGALPGGGLL